MSDTQSQSFTYCGPLCKVVEEPGHEVVAHLHVLQAIPQKGRVYGVEILGQIKAHDSHTVFPGDSGLFGRRTMALSIPMPG